MRQAPPDRRGGERPGWHSSLARVGGPALLLALAAAAPAAAQGDGAGFLLLPVGARAIATGGAVAAAGEGSESVWWNPAAVARETRREIAIHHAQTVLATSDAIIAVFPWRRVGVVAVAANLVDLGEQEATGEQGQVLGTLFPRNVVASLSYARTIGTRLDVGATYKLLQVRLDCSGQCATVPVDATTTSAVDLGVRMSLAGWLPITVGAGVRNAGPGVRAPDRDERDPLPTRWQTGVLYELPGLDRLSEDVVVRLSSDVVSPTGEFAPGLRVGGEAIWQRRVAVRGGYVFDTGDDVGTEAAGPAVGLGLVAGRLTVDIAREFQGLSVDAGQPPTYVSVRFRF